MDSCKTGHPPKSGLPLNSVLLQKSPTSAKTGLLLKSGLPPKIGPLPKSDLPPKSGLKKTGLLSKSSLSLKSGLPPKLPFLRKVVAKKTVALCLKIDFSKTGLQASAEKWPSTKKWPSAEKWTSVKSALPPKSGLPKLHGLLPKTGLLPILLDFCQNWTSAKTELPPKSGLAVKLIYYRSALVLPYLHPQNSLQPLHPFIAQFYWYALPVKDYRFMSFCAHCMPLLPSYVGLQRVQRTTSA